MSVVVRKSAARGHADLGWLNSYHTFSFADYFDRKYNGFNKLRVINEDRVAPSKGFGTHSHAEMEIFSYVLTGELEHKDSMGNREVLKRGDVQFTSAGTGLSHSEYNASSENWVHFLQLWVRPQVSGLKPSYQTKHFSDEEKKGKLRLIVSPDASEGSVHINQDLMMYAAILAKDEKVTFQYGPGRDGYLHVADTKGSVLIGDIKLDSGDGAYIHGEQSITITGVNDQSEFVLFEMRSEQQ